jgi:hypothetical protein
LTYFLTLLISKVDMTVGIRGCLLSRSPNHSRHQGEFDAISSILPYHKAQGWTGLARFPFDTATGTAGLAWPAERDTHDALLQMCTTHGRTKGPCCRKVMSIAAPNPVFTIKQALLSVLRRSLGAGPSGRLLRFASVRSILVAYEGSRERRAYACACACASLLASPPRLRYAGRRSVAYLPHSPTS